MQGLDAYFAMARGAEGITALELTKWFDTNYHYLVPELEQATDLRLVGDKPVREYLEARQLGIETRPVLVGPVSFLLLSKAVEPGFAPLDLLDPLLVAYEQLLGRAARGRAPAGCSSTSRPWRPTAARPSSRLSAAPTSGSGRSATGRSCW